MKLSVSTRYSVTVATIVTLTTFLRGAPAQAQFNDGVGDLLSTYAGAQNGDVDVVSTNVTYDGASFFLTATMNGAIGTTPGAFYVWGFNRGAGTARFSPALANTENVLFDSAVVLRPNDTGAINRIVGGGATVIDPSAINITGSTISATISAAELPTQGFALENYTFNLWPRVGAGNNNQISDFAPNNANVQVQAAAPEPASASLLLLTLPLIAGIVRRRAGRAA